MQIVLGKPLVPRRNCNGNFCLAQTMIYKNRKVDAAFAK